MKCIDKPKYYEYWIWKESKKQLKEIGCKYISYSGHAKRPDECTSLRIFIINNQNAGVDLDDHIVKDEFGRFDVYTPNQFKVAFDIMGDE